MSERTKKGDILLSIKGLKIQGFSDEKWHDIVKGVDLTLRAGEVLGLIGESGAASQRLVWPRWDIPNPVAASLKAKSSLTVLTWPNYRMKESANSGATG